MSPAQDIERAIPKAEQPAAPIPMAEPEVADEMPEPQEVGWRQV